MSVPRRRATRRWFLIGAAGFAGLALTGAEGCVAMPSPRVRRIAYLAPGVSTFRDDYLREELQLLGWTDGENLTIEWRFADASDSRLAELAGELARMPVDVIVADGMASVAVRQTTRTIPIVMRNHSYPIETGLIESLARPGGNVTGTTNISLGPKRLELFKEIVPGLRSVAAFWNPDSAGALVALDEVRAAGRILGIQALPLEVRSMDDLEPVFARATSDGAEALLFLGTAVSIAWTAPVMALVEQSRLPSSFAQRGFVQAGAFMSHNSSVRGHFRRAAHFVDRILRGARPADLPVELVTEFEMVANLKTARSLGLTIPPHVAAQVTEWIE